MRNAAIIHPDCDRSKISITFEQGTADNYIEIGPCKRIDRVRIAVKGSGNRLHAPRLRRVGNLSMTLISGANVSIGEHTSFEDCMIAADRDLHIGADCMISYQTTIRTTDAHGIYDLSTGDMINSSEEIRIEDHVWIGAGALIGKGAHIGRDSVIGAKSLVQKTEIPANVVAAGVPANVVRTGVIWDRRQTENIYTPLGSVETDWLFKTHLEAGRRTAVA